MLIKRILISSIFFIALQLQAQEEANPNSTDNFTSNAPVKLAEVEKAGIISRFPISRGSSGPNLSKSEDIADVAPKEKKRKKKVFYDIKTKRRFTKKGFGNRVTIELFHILKEPITPDPYVRDIHWYDARRQEIRVGGKIDQKYGAILHGTYKKMQGNQVLEEGIFYKGMKHGRWVKLDKDDLLVDKEKYYYGWPKESLVSYYDSERNNMREITPIEYGEKEGNYFYFFETGKIGVSGQYVWDKRVGDWIEYYPTGRRKKVIRYAKDAFDEDFQPYIWKEWDRKGKLVYQRK